MIILERLLRRVVGDSRIAEAILGDLAEERLHWRTVHLLAVILSFALRRPPRRAAFPDDRRRPMISLLQDVRYAVRMISRQPAFALVVIVTMGIGLGANAAVFAMVDGLLFRPLAVGDVAGMVQIYETNAAQGEDREHVSPPNFLDWQRQARSFETLVALRWWEPAIGDGAHDPEQIIGRLVSPDFFAALRVPFAAGRGFVAGEDLDGRNRVVVVSHRLWQRRWAGAPTLVGSNILVDRVPHTVVGVAPQGFEYPAAAEIYAPITFDADDRANRSRRYLEVIGRMRPGASLEQAEGEMTAIAARLADEHRDANGGYGVNLMPLDTAMLDLGLPSVLAVWQVAVLLVLVIAGANVANLLMVRGTGRQRELAVRVAVGAGRWRLVRQLVVESVVLSIAGVALALPIAAVSLRIIKSFMPAETAVFLMGWDRIDIDLRLLGATMAAGIAAGALFGMLPALRASRPDLAESLKEGARGTAGRRRRALQGFVVAQIALALALLVSAGLSTRGAMNLLVRDDGYDPRQVMTFYVALPEANYPDDAARRRFYEQAEERLGSLPGVEHAAIGNTFPATGSNSSRPVEMEGRPIASAGERPNADFRSVTADYFSVIRGAVLRGRAFTGADDARAPRVALIDETMAQRLWPGEDPIGRRFRSTQAPDQPWLNVVGVVKNVRHNWFVRPAPTYYVPLPQAPLPYGVLAVRTRGDEAAVTPAVRQVMREIDPNLPLAAVHSLSHHRWQRTIGMQFVAALMAGFAGIGLFLSAIGIYGVMAYSVSQRTREIGVRIALGATAREVMGMTLRDASLLAAAGVVIGLVAAFGLGKLMAANLFGVVELDAPTFVVFAAVLSAVALAAAGIPARRAMRVDPITALRAD